MSGDHHPQLQFVFAQEAQAQQQHRGQPEPPPPQQQQRAERPEASPPQLHQPTYHQHHVVQQGGAPGGGGGHYVYVVQSSHHQHQHPQPSVGHHSVPTLNPATPMHQQVYQHQPQSQPRHKILYDEHGTPHIVEIAPSPAATSYAAPSEAACGNTSPLPHHHQQQHQPQQHASSQQPRPQHFDPMMFSLHQHHQHSHHHPHQLPPSQQHHVLHHQVHQHYQSGGQGSGGGSAIPVMGGMYMVPVQAPSPAPQAPRGAEYAPRALRGDLPARQPRAPPIVRPAAGRPLREGASASAPGSNTTVTSLSGSAIGGDRGERPPRSSGGFTITSTAGVVPSSAGGTNASAVSTGGISTDRDKHFWSNHPFEGGDEFESCVDAPPNRPSIPSDRLPARALFRPRALRKPPTAPPTATADIAKFAVVVPPIRRREGKSADQAVAAPASVSEAAAAAAAAASPTGAVDAPGITAAAQAGPPSTPVELPRVVGGGTESSPGRQKSASASDLGASSSDAMSFGWTVAPVGR